MNILVIKDLTKIEDLDRSAMALVRGGIIGGCTVVDYTNVNTWVTTTVLRMNDIANGGKC
ncbi:hypothetical protein FVF58_34885 [Paraburkholderia panacisoli]|jgi:hypothetical protein|uniref:Uncharacterized protein n=1 Tax=Paraburkholderia panacisoli TaxID=2603818 RepID=A0A5B0GM23_9BURK|nr:hypothetical protein [Paraburkholderia panacisoli]KAA1003865.1 hypothetical protein FVF58_34885 [Paraburkholderia panacisoli]